MEELLAKLTALLGDAGKAQEIADKAKADGVSDLASAGLLTEADLTGYGVPKIKARQFVADLAAANRPAPAEETATAASAAFAAISLLPQVPTDESFLKMLQVGGKMKVDETDVISAVRVLFAANYGYLDVDKKILKAMKARTGDDPYPPVFYSVQKALVRKAHLEVFSALEVSSAEVFTAENRKDFLERSQRIWKLLSAFNAKAVAYQQSWLTKMANPGLMMAMMRGAQIPGLEAAPDTRPMLNAAASVIDGINKVFAGPGVPVARGMAADAIQIQKLLERPDLPAAVGATSTEDMLRTVLEIAVTAEAPQNEQSIVQYVLAVMRMPTVPVPQLPTYISAVAELGASLQDTFNDGGGSTGSAGGGKPRTF